MNGTESPGMTKIKKDPTRRTAGKDRTEPPWNVVLHNDWDNSMPRVVWILKKVFPGMSVKRPPRSCTRPIHAAER